MSQQLISRSPDLKKLRNEGYEIEISGGHLIVHQIPYVNSNREVKFGKLISTLTINSSKTLRPDTHVMSFMGEYPCNKDGTIITGIKHSNPNQKLMDGIIINYTFSNKPKGGYVDYYEKVVRYIEIITAPARSIDSKLTAKTFKVIKAMEDESVFNYIDTNSSRSNINGLNSKFNEIQIGIIGLGGTGSYILDLVAKTPVKMIHLFDGDDFLQHNAFRSPGAPSYKTLDQQIKKVNYFASIYSQMHRGIQPHPENITNENIELLKNLDHVFICIDNNEIKGVIIHNLLQYGVNFIDVGLGVNIAGDNIIGTIRVTAGTQEKNDHLSNRIGTGSLAGNEYDSNIQISDLNALNAVLAIIKWKKMCGFYQDLKQEHHSTYTINTGQLINDENTA